MIVQLRPKKLPDVRGRVGDAWQLRHPHSDIASPAHVCAWLIFRPGVHMLCGYWLATAISLDPRRGVREVDRGNPFSTRAPGINVEQVTHELTLGPVPHDVELPDVDEWDHVDTARPYTFREQLALTRTADEQAEALLDRAVRGIVGGQVPPNSDFSDVWLYWLRKEAADYREGHRAVAA